MEEIWIIGLGHFGYIAFRRLSKIFKDADFVLVDPVEENLLKCRGSATRFEITDGVEFLRTHLNNGRRPDWIIPALPVHLAAEWILLHLGPEKIKRISLPSKIEMLVPNPIRGLDGNLYVSHANFRCPEDCDEPQDICTITRDKREQNMFELLENLNIDAFSSLAIHSHQLGPGIGGYRPKQLYELVEKVEKCRGSLLVSTACRCHGVITSIERF
jgi:hypothetical protein